MGQILHGSATTTTAVRRAIQNSQESLRVLAKRYELCGIFGDGVNQAADLISDATSIPSKASRPMKPCARHGQKSLSDSDSFQSIKSSSKQDGFGVREVA